MSNFFVKLNCCNSLSGNDDNYSIKQNSENKSRKRYRIHKILLLGTGESGKSTFLKQIRLISGKKFTETEIEEFRDIIYDNIYTGVLFLLQARTTLEISWGDDRIGEEAAMLLEKNTKHCRRQRSERIQCGQVRWTKEEFLEMAPLFQKIWASTCIRDAFNRRASMITEDFSENTRYYLDRLPQIAIPTYYPTDEDIVWSRKPTESIIEEEISANRNTLVFIDVGGQTKERRKWCQTFIDMSSVLFLVACSHYDELYLDKVTGEYRNKLREAIVVFEGIVNLSTFRTVSVIIFFNKTDILKEKISDRISNIRSSFSEFPEKSDEFKFVDVQSFLVNTFAGLIDPNPEPPSTVSESQYQKSNPNPNVFYSNSFHRASSISSTFVERSFKKRQVYRHFTTAVDRKNIEVVFNAMQDTILQNNLSRLMMR